MGRAFILAENETAAFSFEFLQSGQGSAAASIIFLNWSSLRKERATAVSFKMPGGLCTQLATPSCSAKLVSLLAVINHRLLAANPVPQLQAGEGWFCRKYLHFQFFSLCRDFLETSGHSWVFLFAS